MYIFVKSVELKSAGFFWFVLKSIDSNLRPQFVHIKNTSISFVLLFMILLGFLNLSGMFYYTYAGITCRTNSVLSMALHIIQKKFFLLMREKLAHATSRSFCHFCKYEGEGCLCMFFNSRH